ncbi:FAD-dependent oxidoreductase [Amycolatopsis sp. NPDC059021]|uniref:FAD-dependent oxidoreductase n=1 Tax=Amycolatopsis sp. NPDC059021 TaxID=3346704 RepID=UPI00366F30ED
MPENLRVVVVGAGLGGLALAQGLRRSGIDVAVYEREESPTSRLQGYRLRLTPEGLDVLERLLPPPLSQLVWETSSSPSRAAFLSGQTEPAVDRNVAVNRLTLRQILLHGLDDVVEFGRECTGYRANGDKTVTALFADGSHATGDVLVAADGVNSVIRRQYLPKAHVMDTGVRILYGRFPLTPEAAELIPEEMFTLYSGITGPDRQHVGIAPVHSRRPAKEAAAQHAPALELTSTDDYVMCLFGARTEMLPFTDEELRKATGKQLRDTAVAMTREWNPAVSALVELTNTETLFPIFMRSSVPFPQWPTTAVTLIGDAIHAMSPAVGVGANIALRDADTLAARLIDVKRGTELIPALRAYETAMIDYGFDAVRTSAHYGRLRLGQSPLPE